MILKSEKTKNVKSNFYYFNRIIWTKDSIGNVSQKWDIVNDNDKILQTAFEGIYKRKDLIESKTIITKIEYVKILNNRREEALYYYVFNLGDYLLLRKNIK